MKPRHIKWLRIAALAAFFALAWYLGWRTGLTDKLNKKELQELILDAGAWGLLLYVGLVSLGLFIQIPGIVFVAGSLLIYGYWFGMLVTFFGGLVAISVSFVVARMIGGDPLSRLRNQRARAIIGRLKEQPIQTMAVLRVFFLMSPALNVALALSGVRYRDYIAGAVLGMWVPVLVTASALEYIFS